MKENNKKISVIIPVYNVESYLKRCLDSIVEQSYKNIEIILVDDGSKDGSGQICDEYALMDSRIKVIHKENAGAGLARNDAIAASTGDYFAFADADDYFDTTAFEKLINKISETDADLVLYGARFIDYNNRIRKVNSNPFSPRKSVFTAEEVSDVILNMLELDGMTKVQSDYPIDMALWKGFFDAQIIRNNHICFYSERIYKSEDFIFYTEYLSKCKSVVFLEEELYYHCDNENSISHNYSVKTQDKNDMLIEKMLDVIETNYENNKYKKSYKHGAIKVFLEATYIVIYDIFRNNRDIKYKEAKADMDYVCTSKRLKEYIMYKKLFIHDKRNYLILSLMENKCYLLLYILCKTYVKIKYK